jgi:hypothetical protein
MGSRFILALYLYRIRHLASGRHSNMVIRILLAAALVLTGCAPIDPERVMGGKGTPTSEPRKLLDCDLIFPAPSKDTLAP